jgi:hypothetical protein
MSTSLQTTLAAEAHVPYSYTVALEKLRLHSLRTRRHHLDVYFFVRSGLSWP